MEVNTRDPNIINVEKRTLKWFLILFYVISIGFDLIYDSVIPKYSPHLKDDSPNVLGYWIYIIMFALIPVSYYLSKKNLQHRIKYMYFVCYTLLEIINDSISYFGKPELYKSGNIVEVFWLLLSPIFVNNRFFALVTAGLVIKYLLVGFIIQSTNVILPTLLIVIIAIFAYILLNRFQSYVGAIKISFDQQVEGLVKGVIATLELKDPYTKGHSERVARYALEMIKMFGKFSAEEQKTFNYACLLHDIGKVHISDQILMKPARLTSEEFEIIKLHPVVGAEAITKVVGLNNCIDVIKFHHERWDGTGYPNQLKGEDIPFFARVASIADAFDAMTSSRSYRTALSLEEAYNRILDGAGSQFDPELVNAFQKVFPSWKEIHDEWNAELPKIDIDCIDSRLIL